MNSEEIISFLSNFHNIKKLNDEYAFEDVLNFLIKSKKGEVPIIAYSKGVWLNSLVVSKECLSEDYIDKLIDWNIHTSSYSYWKSSDNKFKLSEPCESYAPTEILSKSTPIFLERSIFNHTSKSIEINQKISHRLDIAEFGEKNQFYKLDEYGDKVKVASIINNDDITLCSLKREELDNYLNISNSVLIRFFNICILDVPNPWNGSTNIVKLDNEAIYYKNRIEYSNLDKITYKEIRGFQIIKSNQKVNDAKINYQEFKVLDLKTDKVVINSCDPKKLGNPFVKSEYIDEISPVFFRTEVFKNYYDSDKYIIEDRYIECKGVWSLRYSISEDKSQVIVYIKDLGGLPEHEQNLWKSYNVEPKSNISEHVIKTDFLGEWIDVSDPLRNLKNCLHNFPPCTIDGTEIQIWIEKNKTNIRSLDNLQYVNHFTKEIWELEVKKLHQIIIEGFVGKKINLIAKKLDCYDNNLKSLKQLKKCINKLYGEETAKFVVDPLIKLNEDRNTIEHASNENYPKNILKDYEDKLQSCSTSMIWLSDKIKEGIFNFD